MRSFDVLRAVCLLALPLACARADGDPAAGAPLPTGPTGPVIVELFTSQGCSSCPPADRLLAKLARTDRTLAPLAFHVDYWNGLGWTDPFSLPAWTARQESYARALGERSAYTPQLVVGGAAGMVGSNTSAVTTAIGRAARPALLPATAAWTADRVTVTATAPADADVWVAVWQNETQTRVARGENAGETLTSERVVRRLERVAAAGQRGTIDVATDRAWGSIGAVAFAQRADRKIVASALLPR